MLTLNSQDMARLKKWIMDDSTHKGSNCFALAMICHGDEQGFLLDVNKSKAWRVEDIATDLGVVDTLHGKPKILIFNACRGRKLLSYRFVSSLKMKKISSQLIKFYLFTDNAFSIGH